MVLVKALWVLVSNHGAKLYSFKIKQMLSLDNAQINLHML